MLQCTLFANANIWSPFILTSQEAHSAKDLLSVKFCVEYHAHVVRLVFLHCRLKIKNYILKYSLLELNMYNTKK